MVSGPPVKIYSRGTTSVVILKQNLVNGLFQAFTQNQQTVRLDRPCSKKQLLLDELSCWGGPSIDTEPGYLGWEMPFDEEMCWALVRRLFPNEIIHTHPGSGD